MLKQNIKYTDPDGNDRAEDYWFQVTKPEFLRKAMAEGGQAYVDKIQSISGLTPEQMEGKGRLIMNTFEDILGDAVGKRIETEDGVILDKSPEIRKRFMYSGAYDSFFMDLIERPDSGAIFMRSILPRDAQEEIARLEKENLVGSLADAARTIDGDVETKKAAEPTPFPTNLEKAVEANRPTLTATAPVLEEPGTDEALDPAWFNENRYPTKQELMRMGQDELQLAMKMKQAKAFG